MKGYKVFNSDWTCKGFKFEVGKTFGEDVNPKCCDRGFHFCTKASDCFNYYSFDSNNRVAEVEALGEIAAGSNDTKCCTNKIHIVRELTWHEVLDLVNLGKDCTGLCNSGDWNSGDWNSGNRNSGNHNSGDCNIGNHNSGNRNGGNRNSGDWNSGNRNSGNRNGGDWNSGDWNKASNVVGCFNTQNQKLMFFDEPTDMTFEQWWSSDACRLLGRIDFAPVEWVWSTDMTDEEKSEYPEYKTTGGYLKTCDNTFACKEWWKTLTKSQKEIIKAIPNFHADKFFEITGIVVDE